MRDRNKVIMPCKFCTFDSITVLFSLNMQYISVRLDCLCKITLPSLRFIGLCQCRRKVLPFLNRSVPVK